MSNWSQRDLSRAIASSVEGKVAETANAWWGRDIAMLRDEIRDVIKERRAAWNDLKYQREEYRDGMRRHRAVIERYLAWIAGRTSVSVTEREYDRASERLAFMEEHLAQLEDAVGAYDKRIDLIQQEMNRQLRSIAGLRQAYIRRGAIMPSWRYRRWNP